MGSTPVCGMTNTVLASHGVSQTKARTLTLCTCMYRLYRYTHCLSHSHNPCHLGHLRQQDSRELSDVPSVWLCVPPRRLEVRPGQLISAHAGEQTRSHVRDIPTLLLRGHVVSGTIFFLVRKTMQMWWVHAPM